MRNLSAFFLALVLVACGGQVPAKPKTFLEQVEAVNVANDEAGKKIAAVTCKTYTDGKCTQLGFWIEPEQATKLLKDTDQVRLVLRAAANIPAGVTGQCGDDVKTREACLASAQGMLNTLQAALH